MNSNNVVVLINTITPKQGKLEAVIAKQTSAMQRFAGKPKGWLGSRLHKSMTGETVVMTTIFDSIESHQQWMHNEEFKVHRDELVAMTDNIQVEYFSIAAEAGVFATRGVK